MPVKYAAGPFDPDKYGTPTPRLRQQNGYTRPDSNLSNSQTSPHDSTQIATDQLNNPVSVPQPVPFNHGTTNHVESHSSLQAYEQSIVITPTQKDKLSSALQADKPYFATSDRSDRDKEITITSLGVSDHSNQQEAYLPSHKVNVGPRKNLDLDAISTVALPSAKPPVKVTNSPQQVMIKQIPRAHESGDVHYRPVVKDAVVSKPLSQYPSRSNISHSSLSQAKSPNQVLSKIDANYQFLPLGTLPSKMIQQGSTKNSITFPSPSVITGNPTMRETNEQKLQRLQQTSLQKINSRNRFKMEDGPETTSIKDLQLARTNLTPEKTKRVENAVKALYIKGRNPLRLSQSILGGKSIENKPLALQPAISRASVTPKAMTGQTNGIVQESLSFSAAAAEGTLGETNTVNGGCELPHVTNELTASDDSVRAMHDGDLPYRNPDTERHTNLIGWNGQIQPPPVDWNDRPRFNNTTPEFKNAFNNWVVQTYGLVAPLLPDEPFRAVSMDKIRNIDFQADGLDMVPKTLTITMRNAPYYGYFHEPEITQDSNLVTTEHFESDSKLDPNESMNRQFMQETTEFVVQSWLAHKNLGGEFPEVPSPSQAEPDPNPMQVEILEDLPPNPCRPKINIYLRPAVRADIPQMTKIYNWHIEFGSKTAESKPVEESDMRSRLEAVTSTKLPFIVAVERSKKHFVNGRRRRGGRGANSDHSLVNGHSSNLDRQERVVGWACAQDFTAHEYVEHISAEVEVYVNSDARQQGVGQCLMDKLLEAVDRCYMPRNGYPFYCSSELSHLYSTGGGRDLHKVIFVVRSWQFPKTKKTEEHRIIGLVQNTKEMDVENDIQEWLQKWLESWGFEHEATLKGVGMKAGRFLNAYYFSRVTGWQPQEGKIPPLLGVF